MDTASRNQGCLDAFLNFNQTTINLVPRGSGSDQKSKNAGIRADLLPFGVFRKISPRPMFGTVLLSEKGESDLDQASTGPLLLLGRCTDLRVGSSMGRSISWYVYSPVPPSRAKVMTYTDVSQAMFHRAQYLSYPAPSDKG